MRSGLKPISSCFYLTKNRSHFARKTSALLEIRILFYNDSVEVEEQLHITQLRSGPWHLEAQIARIYHLAVIKCGDIIIFFTLPVLYLDKNVIQKMEYTTEVLHTNIAHFL